MVPSLSKSHAQLVTEPVEASVNATVSGLSPSSGVPLKSAVGAVYFAVRAAVQILNDAPTAVYPKVFDPEVSRFFTSKELYFQYEFVPSWIFVGVLPLNV
ncbi:MAG: hypothetical protein A4E28_01562 [Methanocella sp. PtaU1.Bin125]|nr:MAG: hypothetical protein A4E28_01562 [Methanocella sp. PtaU1.Bin125]